MILVVISLLLTLINKSKMAKVDIEKMKIVETSEKNLLVKKGGNLSMSCTADQEWFFCLWQNPKGEKNCVVKQKASFVSACSGAKHMEIGVEDKSCTLSVDNVTIQDKGIYMCVLNQAAMFHTERSYFNIQMASPAEVKVLKKHSVGNEMTDSVVQDVLLLSEGELVELKCESKRAFPKPTFTWTTPVSLRASELKVLRHFLNFLKLIKLSSNF